MKQKMKKKLAMGAALALLFMMTACGATGTTALTPEHEPKKETTFTVTDYPQIEDIEWSFRDTVRYGEPVAVLDYTNNSDYIITCLWLEFKMKDGVTSEQLNLTDLSGELVPDEEIPEMEPFASSWKVCDPGESADDGGCQMVYNTSPTSTSQCQLMEMTYAQINFVAEDGREHQVVYCAENGGYEVSRESRELYTWVDNELAKMIPEFDTRFVHAEENEQEGGQPYLYIEAYDVTWDDFISYIGACEEMGYVNDYPEEEIDYNYYGTHPNGYHIYMRFIDSMNYMELTLENSEA